MESIGLEVFTTRSAARLTGLPLRTLDTWDRESFFSPSILNARGRGSRRVYSFSDVVAVRIGAQMRELGIAKDIVRLVFAHLQSRKGLSATLPIAPTLLATDGAKVFEISATEAHDLLGAKGLAISVSLSTVVRELQCAALSLHREPRTSMKSENRLVRKVARRVARSLGGHATELIPSQPFNPIR